MVLVPVVLLGLVVWVLPRPDSALGSEVGPVGYPVQALEYRAGAAATAALTWSDGVAVRAPSWSGLVVSVEVGAGDVLVTGTPVAVVDTVTRIAVATPTPFSRVLAVGDRGGDVVMLRTALRALGFADVGEGNVFDGRLRAGVRALCGRLGCSPTTSVFDPSWVVFLPQETVTVGSVSIDVGTPAPGTGDVILTAAATLASARVATDPDAGTQAPSSGQGYVFSYAALDLPLDADFTIPPGADGSGLAGLAASLTPGTASVDGAIQLADPVQVTSVPATSLVTGASGRVCVYPFDDARAGTGAEPGWPPLPVTVVGGSPGMTYVEPITAGQVLANPAEIGGLAPCS
ncbi:peptidoglycan-binding domain-containing protein [Xylanimonas sp. McL0601]|uniref:peptidoglycan-binding domain-containing protein n=1 Tax=Xylanimonas sp. McL0601 TaxID=3414739 RepID=UPI003CF5A0B9